ncbi:MAG TPA: helix-turn-helix domain-containing protein [Verrucomicrobiales bacterium]|nr:helix-turn-helix domain-containing protein [Verrucomicrobiales bacterium]HIL69480.1 helix-turn-helix domain-containing protein [Verrucomicrobiota bacterium]
MEPPEFPIFFIFNVDEVFQVNKALAEMTGVSRQTIIAVESYRYIPSLVLALKIAKALDLSMEEIFKYTEQDGAGQSAASPELK